MENIRNFFINDSLPKIDETIYFISVNEKATSKLRKKIIQIV